MRSPVARGTPPAPARPAASGLAAVLDRLAQPSAIVHADGRPWLVSRAFAALCPGGSLPNAVAGELRRLADAASEGGLVHGLLATDPGMVTLTAERLPPDGLWPAGGVLVQAVGAPVPPPDSEAKQRLTPREREVAALLAGGAGTMAIASALKLSPHTVRRHTESILRKLRIHSRAGVAVALLSA